MLRLRTPGRSRAVMKFSTRRFRSMRRAARADHPPTSSTWRKCSPSNRAQKGHGWP